MTERLQEMSRYVEQSDQFPIRLRGGIGNSTLAGILTDLQTNHTLGDNKSIGAISRFLGCFEPIADPSSNQPESLWDQTATAIMAYKHLDQEDQEQINGMMDTLLWSLANAPQERNVAGHTKDISPHVRELATTIGFTTDTWKHVTEPTQHTQRGKLRIHPKLATASALAAVSLIAACTPARPTITPEATIPAITQPAQTTEIPGTPRPIEIPTPRATDTGVLSSTPQASESTQVYGQNNSGKSYHFAELWSMYLDIQLQPGAPKGKVVDFFDYCTPHPNGCGFNSNDPDFDKKFHGHISGYRVNWVDGEWVYTEIK